MLQSALLVVLLGLAASRAQSVKSCGSAGDIFSNAVFTVTPDPVDPSKPLTIYAAGTLTAPMTKASALVDLSVKALGITNVPVKTTSPLSLSPGLAAGDANVTIGPFTLPKLPGSATAVGTIKLNDPDGKQILCASLNIDVASTVAEEPPARAPAAQQPRDLVLKSCGAASDHLKNPVISQSAGVLKVTGSLDEDVASGSIDADLDVKVLFFKIPIKVNVPWVATGSFTVPKGDISLEAGPSQINDELRDAMAGLSVQVDGSVKINDNGSEEISCLQVDGDIGP
jgi:hypothetical protein